MRRHQPGPPDIPELLKSLGRHDVEYVVVGSVAAQLHGVELQPGDFDIVPSTDEANLTRLVEVLEEIEATPRAFGRWTPDDAGEARWIETETTPEAIEAWRPDPSDPESMDHLYLTCLGDFDVVPELAGHFAALETRAVSRLAHGRGVRVASVEDVLAGMTVPRRPKDRERVAALRELQAALAAP